jgi:hypothetical protein
MILQIKTGQNFFGLNLVRKPPYKAKNRRKQLGGLAISHLLRNRWRPMALRPRLAAGLPFRYCCKNSAGSPIIVRTNKNASDL